MSELNSYVIENLSLAISAHNSQPFKLRTSSPNHWVLLANPDRELPIADPQGKDRELSAGAYLELIDLLLKTKGRKIQKWESVGKNVDLHIQSESDPTVIEDAKKRMALALRRFSFRGQAKEKKNLSRWPVTSYSKYITDPSPIDQIARLYDDVNYRYLTSPGYIEELYKWLRFDSSDPYYLKDGLNIEAMALSGIEAMGASLVMKPAVFRSLSKIGISKSLVLENDKIKSASALLVIFCPKDTAFVEQGRLFYKAWLDMTELDLYGCPMSLLTDAEKEKEQIYSLLGLDPKRDQLVNVLRACVLPKNYKRYTPARLDSKEISG
jgi:hypothetical protein